VPQADADLDVKVLGVEDLPLRHVGALRSANLLSSHFG
jgi:hypothetical protein